MENSLSHASSARKKLLQYEETVKKEQSQAGYLGRTLSQSHSKVMQNILREGFQKQESERAFKRDFSTRGYHSNLNNNRTPSSASGKKLLDIELSSLDGTKFKPLKTSRSKYDEIRIETNNEETVSQYDEQNNNVSIPQFYNDTDEMRSARQNELLEAKRMPFEFSFLRYIVEVILGYGIFIGVLYLIKLGNFPYFELLLILALTLTISPWKISTLLLPLTAIPITLANHYMGLSSLTYVEILVCYFATMAFNEKYKIKIVFILVIVVEILFGLFMLPAFFKLVGFKQQIYFYLFPLLVFALRNFVQLVYWILGYSEALFLQIPLFLIGLEYGTVMTRIVGEIEFWYLIVLFTLQIMNDRTHFFLNVMANLVKFCYPNMQIISKPDPIKRNNHILPAHWNGFSSIHSFHLIACVYLFTNLPLTSSPYSQNFYLTSYVSCGQWYKPLIIWSLVSVYEVMCLVLEKRKENIMLIGYTKNRWYHVLSRGVMLVLGLWMFYIGLGVAAYASPRNLAIC